MDDRNNSHHETVPEKASNALATLEAAVMKRRGEFVAKLAEYQQTLDCVAEDAVGEDRLASSMEDAMTVAHRISGIGKTLGFPDLGDVARQTEMAITAYSRDQDSAALRNESCAQIRHLAGMIKVICADHGKPAS